MFRRIIAALTALSLLAAPALAQNPPYYAPRYYAPPPAYRPPPPKPESGDNTTGAIVGVIAATLFLSYLMGGSITPSKPGRAYSADDPEVHRR